ncbi:MAG: hypothetical protein C4542_09555 [Dehalococcoidia bacterium]|nr:MAG: hypothetical protein C4542_09555 [Dehalococcoidia bacterium]
MADDNKMGTALVLGGVGLGLVVLGLARSGGGGQAADEIGPLAPLGAGEQMGPIHCQTFDGVGAITVPIGDLVAAVMPTMAYAGPGRDSYAYFRLLQRRGEQWVTVYGSGLAGTHLQPANAPTENVLVPPEQPQPTGCQAQSLCAQIWPGDYLNPIAGAPPTRGAATAVLEVYERRTPQDADGYASPTINGRVPVQRTIWFNKINFV